MPGIVFQSSFLLQRPSILCPVAVFVCRGLIGIRASALPQRSPKRTRACKGTKLLMLETRESILRMQSISSRRNPRIMDPPKFQQTETLFLKSWIPPAKSQPTFWSQPSFRAARRGFRPEPVPSLRVLQKGSIHRGLAIAVTTQVVFHKNQEVRKLSGLLAAFALGLPNKQEKRGATELGK